MRFNDALWGRWLRFDRYAIINNLQNIAKNLPKSFDRDGYFAYLRRAYSLCDFAYFNILFRRIF